MLQLLFQFHRLEDQTVVSSSDHSGGGFLYRKAAASAYLK
jgi:hypothetical protein